MLMRPKSWGDFQHYKDRFPPWIKLHRSLLTDREFMCLPIASKALAPLLWLLASESKDGSFDGSLDELQFRLHISRKDYEDGIKPLIDKGFFIVDSEVLADCLQVATPERETEIETKRETKREIKATVVAAPVGVSQSVWDDFVKHRKAKKAQVTQTVIDGITKEAKKAGWPLEDALKETILRNWQSFKADWVANKSFAFQDIARVTVPGTTGPDPALVKIQQDRLKAVPPSIEQLEKMAQLRRAMK